LPQVQAERIHDFRIMIWGRFHLTGLDRAMALPYNYQGNFDEDFLDYVPEELVEQPNNSLNCLTSYVASTEACMRFSAVLPMGDSAIANSSQPVPCSNSNSDISKQQFHPGGMTASEWTRSVRAVRNTPVADYSVPSANTTHHGGYRPPIAVSPFLPALSISYYIRTLWRCG